MTFHGHNVVHVLVCCSEWDVAIPHEVRTCSIH